MKDNIGEIKYIANARMPTEKAHGLQIVQMCEAFADKGVELELIVPWRFNHINEDVFSYYDVESNFKITKLPSLDLVRFGKVGFLIQNITFAVSAFLYSLFERDAVIYSRDEVSLFPMTLAGFKTFWEVHTDRYNILARTVLKKCDGVVSISEGLKKFYTSKGVPEEKMLVAPDAVNIEMFDIDISKEDAREKVGLPQDKKLAIYTGHLYDWKGADTLAESAKYLDSDIHVVLVGGTEDDVEAFRDKYESQENVVIVGRKPHEMVPYYLKAADVLVLPNSAKQDKSALYTSPLKLFEYMAARRPIIATDIPSIRHVLNESNAYFCKADNSKKMAKKIGEVVHAEEAQEKANRASEKAKRKYTWRKRGRKILNFIE